MSMFVEILESDLLAATFTWLLVIAGTVALSYVAIYFERPIGQRVTSLAAIVWTGFVGMPQLINPVPYLIWMFALGTAAAIAIAFVCEWPNTDNRPGPMGP